MNYRVVCDVGFVFILIVLCDDGDIIYVLC